MRVLRFIFGSLLLSIFLVWAADSIAAKRVALVIGNNDYATLPDLRNARTDAEGMAATLRTLGFEVFLKVNTGRRTLYRTLAKFEAALATAEIGLVFYAGHGIQADGRNYLVPSDARIELEEDLRSEAIAASDFLRAMERAGTSLNIVILDACRDNPLPRQNRSSARGLAVPIVPEGIKGTAIVYSAAPGQVAQDGPGDGYGVFTGELLKVLGRPGLTLERVFKETAARVAGATNGRQDPWINSSVKGDFYFNPAGKPAQGKVTSSTPAGRSGQAMELVFWQSIQASDDPAMFDEYLRQFPDGRFAGLAKLKIKKLSSSDASTTSSIVSRSTVETVARFAGSWETNWGTMELKQEGDRIQGTYTWSNGRIVGRVFGRKLKGTWRQDPSMFAKNFGDVEFTLSDDGRHFEGRWRYGRDGEWSPDWAGERGLAD